jgi:hypothetical protein
VDPVHHHCHQIHYRQRVRLRILILQKNAGTAKTLELFFSFLSLGLAPPTTEQQASQLAPNPIQV